MCSGTAGGGANASTAVRLFRNRPSPSHPALRRLSTPLFLPRLQVYKVLKQHLSKYVLAETVDEPASTPAPSPAAEAETTGEDQDKAEAKAAESGDKTAEGSAAATAAADEEEGDSNRGEKRNVDGENGEHAPAAEQTAEQPVEKAAGAAAAAAVKKPDPNGPKCVQLKMKPDWRRAGGGKRRRGNLDKEAGGGGARWAWPEGRPDYCRFVLYKENSDTVSGGTVEYVLTDDNATGGGGE